MKHNTPSFLHQSIALIMKATGMSKRTASDRLASIEKRDAKWKSPTPPHKATQGLTVDYTTTHGWPVWSLKPHNLEDDHCVIIGIHGGGFTSEILFPQWSYYAKLARDGKAEVIVPIYPLAPHGTAASVVPVVADIITEQVNLHGENQVSVIGDSAGGGLATAAIQEVITRNTPTPDKLVLISPWLNLAIDDPSSASIDDPFCSIEALQQSGRLWAGKDTVDAPMVSPIHGNFKGFPTTHVYAGSRDILFPDSLKLQELAQEENLPFSFDLREGLIHGWAGFTFIPEGKEVYPRILKFLAGK